MKASTLGFLASIVLFVQPCFAEGDLSKNLRISRPCSTGVNSPFHGNLPGVSQRWWRAFKNPSFCPYILCGGSCAAVSGVPRVGSFTEDELMSDLTPCSLEDAAVGAGNCCMGKTVDKSFVWRHCNNASCPSEYSEERSYEKN